MEQDRNIVEEVHDSMLELQANQHTAEDNANIFLNPKSTISILPTGRVQVASHSRRVEVQPRFVAQVVTALRMKLGLGAKDRSVPGNVALVRREAAKLMRHWNVRDTDASVHLRWVERCFFEDDTHDALPEWRARAVQKSWFVKWVFGNKQPSYDF